MYEKKVGKVKMNVCDYVNILGIALENQKTIMRIK